MPFSRFGGCLGMLGGTVWVCAQSGSLVFRNATSDGLEADSLLNPRSVHVVIQVCQVDERIRDLSL